MADLAIKVSNVTKTFRLFHEKRNTVYETVSGFFNKKKYFETLLVLDNISFEVKKGEMFGIIGRNGIGKTTLLRLLSGIYKPNSGKISIDGSLVPFLGLGSGFQVEMTATENVILYGKLLGIPRKKIEENVNEVMKFAELERFADTKLKNFSSGMYARLAFATAVQVDPQIILIDEILAVGDIGFKKKSFETFLSYRKRKKSIVLVTHDLNAIRENCDRAMFLNDGKIVEIGEPQQVTESYTDLFKE